MAKKYSSWRWERISEYTTPEYKEIFPWSQAGRSGTVFMDYVAGEQDFIGRTDDEYRSYVAGPFLGFDWILDGDSVYVANCERSIADSLNVHQENWDFTYGRSSTYAPYSKNLVHAKATYYASNAHTVTFNFYNFNGSLTKKAIFHMIYNSLIGYYVDGCETDDYVIARIIRSDLKLIYYYVLPIIPPGASSPYVLYDSATPYIVSYTNINDFECPISLPNYHSKTYGSNYFTDGVGLYYASGYSVPGNSHITSFGASPYKKEYLYSATGVNRYAINTFSDSDGHPDSWFIEYDVNDNTVNKIDEVVHHAKVVNYNESTELLGDIALDTEYEFTKPYVDDNTLYVYLSSQATDGLGLLGYDSNGYPMFYSEAGCVWVVEDDSLVCINPIDGYKPKNCDYIKDIQKYEKYWPNYIDYYVRRVWYVDDRDTVATPTEQYSIYMVGNVYFDEELQENLCFKYKLVPCIGSASAGPNKVGALKTSNKY